jgi:hypothetical protein
VRQIGVCGVIASIFYLEKVRHSSNGVIIFPKYVKCRFDKRHRRQQILIMISEKKWKVLLSSTGDSITNRWESNFGTCTNLKLRPTWKLTSMMIRLERLNIVFNSPINYAMLKYPFKTKLYFRATCVTKLYS